jgi:hypothetical protein
MIKSFLFIAPLVYAFNAQGTQYPNIVTNENSLRQAFDLASSNSTISKIVFLKNSLISLTEPVIYTGSQPLSLIGNDSVIDGSASGSFIYNDQLNAITDDGTLIFNTSGDIVIQKLSIKNSAARGIVINIPKTATGNNVSIKLDKVQIINSALYGLHIDDNVNPSDTSTPGSKVGIDLKINQSTFFGNGTGATDFDGIRVDERGEGGINVFISSSNIDANGGDGIELDEAGNGDVKVTIHNVTLNENGFYNSEDPDDGFDIDEADDGSIQSTLNFVNVNRNMDKGLDFDEIGNGSIELKLKNLTLNNNGDEAIKIDEEDSGDIEAKLEKIGVDSNADDGIQFTELGEGNIDASIHHVSATNNDKYGIKLEQWVSEDEETHAEEPGRLEIEHLILSGNGKSDNIKTNNIMTK